MWLGAYRSCEPQPYWLAILIYPKPLLQALCLCLSILSLSTGQAVAPGSGCPPLWTPAHCTKELFFKKKSYLVHFTLFTFLIQISFHHPSLSSLQSLQCPPNSQTDSLFFFDWYCNTQHTYMNKYINTTCCACFRSAYMVSGLTRMTSQGARPGRG